jgi:hypothetical protein
VIALSQVDDQLPSSGLLGLRLRSVFGGQEEPRIGIAPEVMAEDVESGDGIAEALCDVLGALLLDEVGTEGFVLALFGEAGFEEEAADVAYIFRCFYTDIMTLSQSPLSVNGQPLTRRDPISGGEQAPGSVAALS